MKLSVKPELLKFLALTGGILGLVLYVTLYTTGMDEKGLLMTGHWAGTALTALNALVLAAVILLTRPISGPDDYRDAHPASLPGALSCFALGIVLGLKGWQDWSADSSLEILSGVLTLAAAAALLYLGICRLGGWKPFFLCHGVVCACFAIRMVWQYQSWSSDPQLMDYVFYMGAYVALMLTAYQQAAFDADMGSHRVLWATGLAAVYLCCVALRGGADAWILLTGGAWALTNLTSLKARARRQRPALNLDSEPQEEV